jgi:UDP-N-acetylmuramoyl-tripeptide--D-alanyl-D-alanine ligase
MKELIETLCKKLEGLEPRFICDSRQIVPGDVFVALKGERVDGHEFVEQALDKGAVLALVKEGEGKGRFVCHDPFEFIQKLAQRNLETYQPKIIGITGSCGKTTTKRFLQEVLNTSFSVFATPGNFNSQIGLPLALCSLKPEHEIAILEMGMSRAGDIAKLTSWIKVDIALITSIGLSHAENFKDLDQGIARAKAEILNNHPIAFFNERTEKYPPFQKAYRKHVLQTDEIKKCEMGYLFKMGHEWKGPFAIQLQVPCLLENMHLVLACAYFLGMSDEAVALALGKLTPEKQRLSHHRIQGIDFIDDSYNASPSSMKEAISYLKSCSGERKIAVLGSMKELGEVCEKEHLALVDPLSSQIDHVLCLGKEMKPVAEMLGPKASFFSTLLDLQRALKTGLRSGDRVLIKGSHSTGLHALLDSFDKIEIQD